MHLVKQYRLSEEMEPNQSYFSNAFIAKNEEVSSRMRWLL